MRVRGNGPVPARIMLVSDYPGKDEAATGRSLVGRTGKEVDRWLNGSDLPAREDIYVTNLIKEWNVDGEYSDADQERDTPELLAELADVAPEIILTLGRRSARFFLGDVDLEDIHAIPWTVSSFPEVGGWAPFTVFSIYNPAAGFKNSEIQNSVTYGFMQAIEFFAGRLSPRPLFDDAFPDPVYLEVTDPAWMKAALTGAKTLYVDTEGIPRAPWSIQIAFQPGTAYLVHRNSAAVLRELVLGLIKYRPKLIYHSALHDRPMMRALFKQCLVDMDALDRLDFGDTMILAYLLQVEPQGLKSLCVRHAGMLMESYAEVLAEPAHRVAVGYLESLLAIEDMEWEEAKEAAFWAELAKGRKIKTTPKLPKTKLHKSVERCLKSKEPRRLWGDQVIDIHVDAYRRLGDMPEATLDLVERPKAIHYGCRDADGTSRVEPVLLEKARAMGLEETYNLELKTYPLIDRMGTVGMRPDLKHFSDLSDKLAFHIGDLYLALEQQTGIEDFNANSDDQVEAYLFGTLNLPGSKRTKGGRYSTNKKILEALERQYGSQHPVISTIREYRETYKLKNTFVDRIPDFVRRWPFDGRVHPTFRTTRVVTGRLAASDPNMLALPKHGKFAKDFRRGWVADPGHSLYSWDQSQVELRVLAHLSEDPRLLAAFREGLDLHAALAVRIFGGTEDDHKKGSGRLAAKAINFGIPMGMQAPGLTVELRKNGVMVSQDDAQRWLDDTMALYAEVPRYQNWMIAQARRNGYIRCLSGRIRYIGGIKAWDDYTRGEAERFAFSTPIQEGAQFIMKTAERHVWEDVILPFQQQGHFIEPLVQIHDDLVMEGDDDDEFAKELNVAMRWAMTETFTGLKVPLATSGDKGPNWQDMEEIAI